MGQFIAGIGEIADGEQLQDEENAAQNAEQGHQIEQDVKDGADLDVERPEQPPIGHAEGLIFGKEVGQAEGDAARTGDVRHHQDAQRLAVELLVADVPPSGDEQPKQQQAQTEQQQPAPVFAAPVNQQGGSEQNRQQHQPGQLGEAGQGKEQPDGEAAARLEAIAQAAEQQQDDGGVEQHRQAVVVHGRADENVHRVQRGDGGGGKSHRRALRGDVGTDFVNQRDGRGTHRQAETADEQDRQPGPAQRQRGVG